MQELRHAVRALAKSPGLTAAATATLALGIGGNTAIFSTVERMVRPLPFRDAQRLVRITDAVVAPGGGLYRAHVLPLHWAPVAQGTRSFDRASAQRPERHARSMRQNRVGASIIASFAAFGLLLATIGIFATVSFVAAQRRPEIGVRIAVGASPLQVRRLILRQGVSLALAGTGIGLVLALAANGVLSSSIEDFCRRPGLCAAVAGALLLLATAASDLPARRAAAADVLRSLHAD